MFTITVAGETLTDEQMVMLSEMVWCAHSEWYGCLSDDEERVMHSLVEMLGGVCHTDER